MVVAFLALVVLTNSLLARTAYPGVNAKYIVAYFLIYVIYLDLVYIIYSRVNAKYIAKILIAYLLARIAYFEVNANLKILDLD